MTLEEANKYADEMDKLTDEREESIKKLMRVRCSDKHREFIEWLLTEEIPCDTCGYEEGSIYCKEHCPHEAKIGQEPCDDAISRQAVIDSLHSKFADGFDSDRWWNSMSVLYAINKVPPVNPTKTGWIPVSERLPEEDGLYLVYTEEQSFVCSFEDNGFFIDDVLAWMPLPKPYELQESEDKDADKKCTYKETGCGSCKRQLDCPIEADTTEIGEMK